MQDRFKFRIWHEPLKQMHYNDFIITSTGYAAKIYQQGDYIMKFNQADLEFDKQCKVMQCTGMEDKIGKLIYEGDILLSPDAEDPYMIIVEWDNEKGFIIKAWNGKEFEYALSDDEIEDLKCFEIIGNIYENPELIKGEDNA